MTVTYEQAREALAARLSSGAIEHSERVAATAEALASMYGVDQAEARLAGLLHDWDREVPHAELLARARSAGMDVSEVDEAVPYLLHGPVAASDLRSDLPGLSEGVLEAIGAHTYGAPGMSDLAMITYVADTIEPSRTHPGVDSLRATVGERSLRELFFEVYAHSLHHLVDARRRIHPRTVATWNRLVTEDAR